MGRGFTYPYKLNNITDFNQLIRAENANWQYIEAYIHNYLYQLGNKYGTTLVIASSTSNEPLSAHYVCDGSGDDVVIQEAIDALPVTGGEIVFLEGTYDITAQLTLPADARIKLTSKGALFDVATDVIAIDTNGARHVVIDGFGFTNGSDANSNSAIIGIDSDSAVVITDNDFFDIDTNFIIADSGADTAVIVNNVFRNINLRVAGGGFTQGALVGHQEPGAGIKGVFVGNICSDITKTTAAGFTAYIVYNEGGDSMIATGNYIEDSTGLDDYFADAVVASHNVIDNVMVAGDHTGTDHGTLSGLTDDDHTQYLNTTRHDAHDHTTALGTAALGDLGDVGTATPTDKHALLGDGDSWESRAIVEADISDLDHTDDAAIHDDVAGEIAALTQKVTPVGADHVLIEDSEASNAKKRVTVTAIQSAATDHGSLTGLSDDDHPQYLLHSQVVSAIESTDQTGITSTTFVAGSPVCGVAFVAPPSGQVWVNWYGFLEMVHTTTNSRRGVLGWELRTGSTIGSGTEVVAAEDVTRVIGAANQGANPSSWQFAGGDRYLVTGLTPGSDYNVQTMHRVNSTGITMAILERRISVEPA